MTYDGYLAFGGREVINSERARGYAETADCPMNWLKGMPCFTLPEAVGDTRYDYSDITTAPWYDSTIDEISRRFYGVYGLSIDGVEDSTRSAVVTESIDDGGVIGRSRRATRNVTAKALLIGRGQDAVEYGMSWLTAALDPDGCGQVSEDCGTAQMGVFSSCPPARRMLPEYTEWVQQAENFALNPSFEYAGTPVTVFENLITNPNFIAESGGTVTIPAQTIYTNPLTGANTTGWATSLVAANGSGSTGASIGLTGASPSQAMRLTTVGATTSVNPTAAVRAVYTLTTIVGVTYTLDYSLKAVSGACIARVTLGTTQGPEVTSNVLSAQPQLSFVATATTTTITLDVYDNPASTGTRDTVYGDLGGLTVTQAAYTVPAPTTVAVYENLYTNPSFETGAAATEFRRNKFADPAFTRTTVGDQMTIIQRADLTTSSRALTVTRNATGGASRPLYRVPVTPNAAVTVSAKRLLPSGAISAGGTADGQLRIMFSDASFNDIAGTEVFTALPMTGTTTLLASITATSPANAAYVNVGFHAGGAVGEATRWSEPQVEMSLGVNPFFIPGVVSPDSDVTAAWAGTANASDTILTVFPPKGPPQGHITNGGSSQCYQSSKFPMAGVKSLRIKPMGTSSQSHYQISNYNLSLFQAGKTYTVLGTITIPDALTGTLAPQARSIAPTDSVNSGSWALATAPNAPGTYDLRTTFTVPAAATWAVLRLYNGASYGNGDVYWDKVMIVEGVYNGPYIDGSVPHPDPDFTTAWTGTSQDSISRVSGTAVSGIPSIPDRCLAVRSSRVIDGVPFPLRLIAKRSGTDTFVVGGTIPANARVEGTLLGTRYQDAAFPAISNRALWVGTPEQQVSPVNAPGAKEYRLFYANLASSYAYRFYHGGTQGDPDVWWTHPGLHAGTYQGEWFAGDHPLDDEDFETSWSGAADNSTSVAKAYPAVGVNATGVGPNGQPFVFAIRSSRWASEGQFSLRILGGLKITSGTYVTAPVPASVQATGGSARAVLHVEEDYFLDNPYFPSVSDALAVAAQPTPPGPGTYPLGIIFPTGTAFVYLLPAVDPETGLTTVDTWFDELGIRQETENAFWFDGDGGPVKPGQEDLVRYFWAGEPNNSYSIMETRQLVETPQTDEQWADDIDKTRRFMRGAAAISGPFKVSEMASGEFWAYEVQFTLAGGPSIIGVTKALQLAPALPVVVQDIAYNLAPYPSAEKSSGTMVAATNYSTNPSVETDATGWVAISDGSVITSGQLTSGRVTGELAASGTSSFRSVFTAPGASAAEGYFGNQQEVNLSSRPAGSRVSINLWSAGFVQSGVPAGMELRMFAYWRGTSGGAALRTDDLGTVPVDGGNVSLKSLLPPAGANFVLVRAQLKMTSWNAGTVVRLYSDALAVTVP